MSDIIHTESGRTYAVTVDPKVQARLDELARESRRERSSTQTSLERRIHDCAVSNLGGWPQSPNKCRYWHDGSGFDSDTTYDVYSGHFSGMGLSVPSVGLILFTEEMVLCPVHKTEWDEPHDD